MKIAMLIEENLRKELFSGKAMSILESDGELRVLGDGGDINKVLSDAQIVITSWGSPRMDDQLLSFCPSLKLMIHAAGSVKPVVSDVLYDKGIRVSSCACVLSRGVSEMAIGLTITAAKNVFAFNNMIHQGTWPSDKSSANELFDITVGVVGCGFAGAHYIELLRDYGVEIIAYDPGLSADQISKIGAKKVELEYLLCNSDIVSLHAPSIPSTYHMINEKTLSLMKDKAILINTARGSLIDETALAEVMSHGKLKYALLDVTDPEPPNKDNPLLSIPNVIMTPHVAGLANNGKLKIGMHVCAELESFLKDGSLYSEVTKDMLASIA